MKRLLASIVICLMVVLSLTVASAADAKPMAPLWMPSLSLADTPAPSGKDLLTQLETEILPQLETILTPEQCEQFKTDVAKGTSFRKVFKSLMLTPEQKTQLKTLLKSISIKDAFASLTPEQKKQLFMKKKELFKPTSGEITEKINASMKSRGASLPEGVQEKIDAGIRKKDAFIPTPEAITEKITAGMNALKDKMED